MVVLSLLAWKQPPRYEAFDIAVTPNVVTPAAMVGDEQVVDTGLESLGGGAGDELRLSVATSSNVIGMQAPVLPELGQVSALEALEASGFAFGDGGDLTEGIGDDAGPQSGRGKGKGIGVGNMTQGFARPGKGRVVKKGRFAAWTVPTDPGPRQPYLIVIEVEWPKTTDKKLLRSRRTDLSGRVEGSDGYFQIIEKSGFFIPNSNQIVVPVPGGEQNVRDTIRVSSKILEETQELTIAF